MYWKKKPMPAREGPNFGGLCMMSQQDLPRAQAVKTEALG
jgi:hypothetical protein